MTIRVLFHYSRTNWRLQVDDVLQRCANFFHIVNPLDKMKFSVNRNAIWNHPTALVVLNPFLGTSCQLFFPIQHNLSYSAAFLRQLREEEEGKDLNGVISNQSNHQIPAIHLAYLGGLCVFQFSQRFIGFHRGVPLPMSIYDVLAKHVYLFGPAYSSDNAGDGPTSVRRPRILNCCYCAPANNSIFENLGLLCGHVREQHDNADLRVFRGLFPSTRLCQVCYKVYGSGSALANHQKKPCSPSPNAQQTHRLEERPNDEEQIFEDNHASTLARSNPHPPGSRSSRDPTAVPYSPSHSASATASATAPMIAAHVPFFADTLAAATTLPTAAVTPAAFVTVPTPATVVLPIPPTVRSARAIPDSGAPLLMRCVRHVPPSMVAMCRTILERVLLALREAGDTPEGVTERHVVALLAIPRLLQNVRGDSNTRKTKRRLATILNGIDVLDALDVAPDDDDALNSLTARMSTTSHRSTTTLPEKRIKQLVTARCLSRAVRLIESASEHQGIATSSDADIADELVRLFPTRTQADDLPLGTLDREVNRTGGNGFEADVTAGRDMLQFSQEEVDIALGLLPAQSAASFSGWTYDLVQQLSDGPDGVTVRRLIRAVATLFMQGNCGPVSCWTQDRLVPLRKRAGSIRPIVVGEVWPRIFSRIAATKISRRLVGTFLPLQWGIGSQGGPEVVAHAAHLFTSRVEEDSGMAIQLVDFTNAFNSIRRRPIFLALERYVPSLVPWYRWCYGSASEIWFSDGTPAAKCQTGVRQGDPLGCLLFCLGIHQALQEAQETHPSLTILADLDDVTVMGPIAEMPAFLDTMARVTAPLGLSLHPEKSIAWAAPDTRLRAADLAVTHTGHRIMGSFVGTTDYQLMAVADAVRSCLDTVSRIASLEPSIALPLIQSCVNTRPVYLARTTPPRLTDRALYDFDLGIDQAILRVAGSNAGELAEVSQILRSLPQAEGGLGIPRLHSVREAAWTASFCHATSVLSEYRPGFLRQCSETPVSLHTIAASFSIVKHLIPSVFRSNTEDAEGDGTTQMDSPLPVFWPTTLPNDTTDLSEARAIIPRQKELCQSLVRENITRAQQLLSRGHDRPGRAWWLSQSFKGSGLWLSFIPKAPNLQLTPDEYRSSLSLRLMLPCCWTPVGTYSQCQHCIATHYGDQAQDSRFHPLSCIRAQGKITKRHDRIRDILASGLRRLFGGHTVQLEPAVAAGLRRPDIILTIGARTFIIDVAVANPTCRRYLNKSSDLTALAAADTMEEHKRREYAGTLASLQLQPDAMIPFVLEATGRLGKSASTFLEQLETSVEVRAEVSARSTIKFMLAHIRCCLHRGNAICVRFHREDARVMVTTGGAGIDIGLGTGLGMDAALDPSFADADVETGSIGLGVHPHVRVDSGSGASETAQYDSLFDDADLVSIAEV